MANRENTSLAESTVGTSSISRITPDSEPPSLVSRGGDAALFAWEEFVFGKLRNPHTRRAYERAIRRFLADCEAGGCGLTNIRPRHVGTHLDGLQQTAASKKVVLSALRHFFDILVQRHVVVLNPSLSVRGERLQVVEGSTPDIGVKNARKLLSCIDAKTLVGRRDYAAIAVLIYTASRVGAVSRLRVRDFYDTGDGFALRFVEKGGKAREIPTRHDLKRRLIDYVVEAGLADADGDTPLFRSAVGRTGKLTSNGMTAGDMNRMVKRRLKDAGLPSRLSPHSLRVTTITDLLSQGVPLEDVQHLAGHADPRTTRLYDRRGRKVTQNIVERISI